MNNLTSLALSPRIAHTATYNSMPPKASTSAGSAPRRPNAGGQGNSSTLNADGQPKRKRTRGRGGRGRGGRGKKESSDESSSSDSSDGNSSGDEDKVSIAPSAETRFCQPCLSYTSTRQARFPQLSVYHTYDFHALNILTLHASLFL